MPMTVVLVVDDELQVVRMVARLLRRHGCDVRTACSAKEALGLLEDVDVLLTDLRMPEMNGIELVDEAKRRRSSLRCFVMSGDGLAVSCDTASRVVDGRLPKPFTNEELIELVSGVATMPVAP